jgi:DNA-binding protein HU-beta
MNKADLIAAVAERSKTAKAHVEAVIDGLGNVTKDALASGDEVTLPGLGKLSAKTRAARTGRNPSNGEAVEIPAKTVPKFTPAKALKDALA